MLSKKHSMTAIYYLFRLTRSILFRYYAFCGYFCAKLSGIKFGLHCSFLGIPVISMKTPGSILIGSNVMLISIPWMTALGVARPVILRTLTPEASIHIGNNTGMSGVCICAAKSIRIGKDCLLGADVIITDTDFHGVSPELRNDPDEHYRTSKPVIIEDNVFIGARSIILKGVTIGTNSVIGAGSIVSGNIPANIIAGGNPCRILKQLLAL